MSDPLAGEPGALRIRIDHLTTALKQISDLTGPAALERCNCVQCQVHQIAAKQLEREGWVAYFNDIDQREIEMETEAGD